MSGQRPVVIDHEVVVTGQGVGTTRVSPSEQQRNCQDAADLPASSTPQVVTSRRSAAGRAAMRTVSAAARTSGSVMSSPTA